ncbi:MAG: diacylglycerol kinase family protein [Thermodesulfobacteriota bacterium]
MNVAVIANPVAGKGKTGEKVREFSALLKRAGVRVQVRFCEMHGDAQDAAQALDDRTDRIVVAGGDGTVNEVINGLSDPSLLPILHLPTGTANMLGLELSLPKDLSSLARILQHGTIRRIDMGLIGTRRFLLVAGAGFDACVTREVKRLRGKSLGYAGYVRPIAGTLATYRPSSLRVVVDGNQPLFAAHVMALKTRFYGGYFHFAHEARLDSGCFEIRAFHSGTRRALVHFSVAAALGRLANYRDMTRLQGTRIEIESDDDAPVQVDGDYFGTTPVIIELVPAVLPVVAPA